MLLLFDRDGDHGGAEGREGGREGGGQGCGDWGMDMDGNGGGGEEGNGGAKCATHTLQEIPVTFIDQDGCKKRLVRLARLALVSNSKS